MKKFMTGSAASLSGLAREARQSVVSWHVNGCAAQLAMAVPGVGDQAPDR